MDVEHNENETPKQETVNEVYDKTAQAVSETYAQARVLAAKIRARQFLSH